MSTPRYRCWTDEGINGACYSWTETNYRRACARVARVVADGFRDCQRGGVVDLVVGREIASYNNVAGRAVRLDVG